MDKQEQLEKTFELWRNENNVTQPVAPPELERVIGRFADFFLPGKFYYYIVNFAKLTMEYVHPNIKEVLGISPKEFSLEKYLSVQHPDDLKLVHQKEEIAVEFLLSQLNPEQIPLYKVVYMNRMQRADGKYIKLLHQAKTIKVSKDGKVQYVLGVHTDITHLDTPLTKRVSFIGDNGIPSYYSDDLTTIKELDSTTEEEQPFSPQEMRIIRLIAEGKSTKQIAEELFVTENTIKTHRKHILQKSDAQNSVQLIVNCFKAGIL